MDVAEVPFEPPAFGFDAAMAATESVIVYHSLLRL